MKNNKLITVLEYDDVLYKTGDIIHVTYINRAIDVTIDVTGKILSFKEETNVCAPNIYIILDCSYMYNSYTTEIKVNTIKSINKIGNVEQKQV